MAWPWDNDGDAVLDQFSASTRSAVLVAGPGTAVWVRIQVYAPFKLRFFNERVYDLRSTMYLYHGRF